MILVLVRFVLVRFCSGSVLFWFWFVFVLVLVLVGIFPVGTAWRGPRFCWCVVALLLHGCSYACASFVYKITVCWEFRFELIYLYPLLILTRFIFFICNICSIDRADEEENPSPSPSKRVWSRWLRVYDCVIAEPYRQTEWMIIVRVLLTAYCVYSVARCPLCRCCCNSFILAPPAWRPYVVDHIGGHSYPYHDAI